MRIVQFDGIVGLVGLLALGACGRQPAPRDATAPASPVGATAPQGGEAPAPALELGLLTRESAFAVQAGAGPLSLLGLEVTAEGDRVGAFVRLSRDECTLLLARGTPGVEDVDLLVFEEDGATRFTDEGADPRPGVVLCTQVPRRVFVAARVTAGRGWLALGAQQVPRASVDAVAKATGARAHPAAASLDAFAALDVKAREARRGAGGAWEEIKRVGVPVDALAGGRVLLPLDAGRCVHVLAVPSDETAPLDVEIEDGQGRVLVRAEERGRDRVAVVCGSVGDELSATIRPRVGAGLAAVIVARTTAETALDIVASHARVDASPTLSVRDAERAASKEVAPLALSKVASGEALAEVGKRRRIAVALPSGCVRVDLAGGAPLAGVRAEVWSAAGARLAAAEGGARAVAHVCSSGLAAVLELEATGRSGPVAWMVHHDAGAQASLAAPEGGPLLDRILAGRRVAMREVREVRRLSLRERERAVVELSVPAGRCARVGASVGRGGRGVELRLVSRGEDVDVGRAAEATAARACAPEARALAITATVTVGAGAADGLLAWLVE